MTRAVWPAYDQEPSAGAPQRRPAGAEPVIVEEVIVGGHDRPAYVVRPRRLRAGSPGVLWLHWLGNERSDRSQFLSEAIELAGRGCVSVLPDGGFPWHRDPQGTLADRVEVELQLNQTRAAFRALATMPGVDADRLAVVGHDYGAMYALAGAGFDARAVVAVAPDDRWDRWFLAYWRGGASPDDGYVTSFYEVDPLRGAMRCQDRLLLQWAQLDEYVARDVPASYAEAAPLAWAVSYRNRDHRVGGTAARERLDFLVRRLGLDD